MKRRWIAWLAIGAWGVAISFVMNGYVLTPWTVVLAALTLAWGGVYTFVRPSGKLLGLQYLSLVVPIATQFAVTPGWGFTPASPLAFVGYVMWHSAWFLAFWMLPFVILAFLLRRDGRWASFIASCPSGARRPMASWARPHRLRRRPWLR